MESILRLSGALKGLGECVPVDVDRCGNATTLLYPTTEAVSLSYVPTEYLDEIATWRVARGGHAATQVERPIGGHALDAFSFFA